ncbi:MAG: DNA/RNA nuclease SfsA, partial [Oscillospiraceae bacterium]|nr:DNA/RNA nuclease SfsA [Oscillospiraceae bacterium]
MKYDNVTPGVFLSRPNRFIANVLIDRKTHVCHVKNTGRCRELLIPGAEVFLQRSSSPARKTEY